jgi:hypothetical protein
VAGVALSFWLPLLQSRKIMSRLLTPEDDLLRTPGPESNWNESRYADFYDPVAQVGGWFRLGNRVNEGHGELTVCLHLPDGSVGFLFQRVPIDGNVDAAGGLSCGVERSFETSSVVFAGWLALLPDPKALVDPKRALAGAKQIECRVELVSHGQGMSSVLGFDQEHIARIFLPGQAQGHYQHLVRSVGTVRINEQTWHIDGCGGRDHSWGPRNWHAKTWFRWLIAGFDANFGFMLTRSLGGDQQRRGGFVWQDGQFHLLDDVELHSDYSSDGYHTDAHARFRSSGRIWSAQGRTLAHLPLRHRSKMADGSEAILRIVKSPTHWTLPDGRSGYGMTEYHDQMHDGKPAGLGI